MKTLAPCTSPNRRASLAVWLAVILGLMIFAGLTAAVGIWSMLHASGEVVALRESVMTSTSVRLEKQIELGVGPLVWGTVRAGMHFVELEPEVRSALGAVRGTSVGVYRLTQPCSTGDRAGMLDAVDQAMKRRGWERILGVLHEHECVLAYLPVKLPSTRDLRLSVLVLDGEQLVVASVRANPEPVMDLLLREADRACREQGFQAAIK